MAQVACANAEVAAMNATNDFDRLQGRPPSYDEHHFRAVADNYCIGNNAVLQCFQDANQ